MRRYRLAAVKDGRRDPPGLPGSDDEGAGPAAGVGRSAVGLGHPTDGLSGGVGEADVHRPLTGALTGEVDALRPTADTDERATDPRDSGAAVVAVQGPRWRG